MNYQEINRAILEHRDINESLVRKDAVFYKYLLNNKVAYYYANNLSKNGNETERAIIERGREFTQKYLKTLEALVSLCKDNHIDFLLFKTHKYIDEVVDGDIDLLVKPEDFQRFLQVFSANGFDTEEDEPQKGKCEKEGLVEIEPHVNISWRTDTFLTSEYLWQNVSTIHYGTIEVKACSPEVELLAAAGEFYFSPEYIDLYRLKAAEQLLEDADLDLTIGDSKAQCLLNEYVALTKKVKEKCTTRKLPYFFSSLSLLAAVHTSLSIPQIAEIIFKNFYWKVRYAVIDKLPFTHDWHI